MINSVHLSGLQLSALNFSSGRDVGECDSLALTKMWVENFSTYAYTVACLRGGVEGRETQQSLENARFSSSTQPTLELFFRQNLRSIDTGEISLILHIVR